MNAIKIQSLLLVSVKNWKKKLSFSKINGRFDL